MRLGHTQTLVGRGVGSPAAGSLQKARGQPHHRTFQPAPARTSASLMGGGGGCRGARALCRCKGEKRDFEFLGQQLLSSKLGFLGRFGIRAAHVSFAVHFYIAAGRPSPSGAKGTGRRGSLQEATASPICWEGASRLPHWLPHAEVSGTRGPPKHGAILPAASRGKAERG